MTPTEVTPGVWRGAQPTQIEDWLALSKLGIKFTLDLETGHKLWDDGSPLQEALTSERYGIRTFAHPLGEFFAPTDDELKLACSVIHDYQPIYIHCRAGLNRTGMVSGRWLMFCGQSRSFAIKDVKTKGMQLWYYWWTWFL